MVDATDQVLGRLATNIATLLIGKGKPSRVPNMDCGDFVIVVNAGKYRVTGNKLLDKEYFRHSKYPTKLKREMLGKLEQRKPGEAIRRAVRNMLPKTKLRDSMLKRLMIYTESQHPHEAQKPQPYNITS